ncbi:hypothetical protein niasHS_014933 [Heterodera schachtii]|uniref:C3H1-type domain-containing protein n=1 Tax=Heterodera schachtii TaxID=97005 RepID=A0ABD2IX99_HETSC
MVQEINSATSTTHNQSHIQQPLPPNSPNPSLSSKSNCDDEEKWRHLMEKHHELCDLEKCLGKRINGLFVCQFSNIPGHLYSQYLRHRRRQGAFKTKPCRNYYGPSRFCPAGDQCSFFHEMDEKRELLQTTLSTNLLPNAEGGVDPSLHSFALFEASDNGHAPQMVFCGNDDQHQQTLNSLIDLVTETYQRMCKQVITTDELVHSVKKYHKMQQQKSDAEFSKSFHPFGESYPLKNLRMDL